MDDPSELLSIALNKFINHVDDLVNEEDPAGNGFNREYRTLREIAAKNKENDTFPATYGKLPCNIKKNRYRDIVPFDSCRVELQQIEGVEGSDYINASYILGRRRTNKVIQQIPAVFITLFKINPFNPKYQNGMLFSIVLDESILFCGVERNVHNNQGYIASQGPLTNTIDDFWRMVWELKVKVVIMACKEVEGKKNKCAKYWPDEDEERECGDIKVRYEDEDWLAEDCAERRMAISRDGSPNTWTVTQYHYTGWPDHGIPDDRDVILTMMAKMRQIRSEDKDFAPVVVHCSAGCGRTGTICAIDYTWDVLKTGKLDSDFSMFELVESMREQRQSMIQTPEQYELAHLCVQELFQKHVQVIDENIYANCEPKPLVDEEYYNVKIPDNDQDTKVSPYETVNVGTENNVRKSTLKQKTSILEKDALATVDVYVNVDDNDIPNNQAPQIPDKPRRESVKETENQVTKQTKGAKEGYINVFKQDAYENTDDLLISIGSKNNMEKTDNRNSPTSVTSPKPVISKKPVISQSPKQARSGPVFTDSSVSNQKSGPTFETSGPTFESSVPSSPLVPSQVLGATFESSVPSGPVFESSSQGVVAESRPAPITPTTPPKQGPTFVDSAPTTGVNERQKVKFVSRITLSSAASRVSYVDTKTGTSSSSPLSKPNDGPASEQPTTGQSSQQSYATQSHKQLTRVPAVGQNSHYADVTNENSTPSNDSNHYSLAYNPESTTSPPAAQSVPDHSSVNLYSAVNKSKDFSRSLGSGSDVYESIAPWKPPRPKSDPRETYSNIDGSFSDSRVSDQGDENLPPVIPERRYKQEEEDRPDVATVTLERNKGAIFKAGQNPIARLKISVKDKFGKGGGSEDSNIDTSYIPGFNKRIDKKPGGPKEKPNFWKKILK